MQGKLYVLAVLTLASSAEAGSVPVSVEFGGLDEVNGSGIADLGVAFTNESGALAVVGELFNGQEFVYFDGIATTATDLVGMTASVAEDSVAASGGRTIFEAFTGGKERLVTDQGELIADDDVAPGLPGATISFVSRPTCIADGSCYWVSGVDLTGNGSTDDRVLYRSLDGTPATIEIVIDPTVFTVDGFGLASSDGVGLSFHVSDDGGHRANILRLDTGSTLDDSAVYVTDGVASNLVAREGQPTGDGDDWENFHLIAINASGTVAFSGDTDGNFQSDAFIAVDGVIEVREGDVVGGLALPAGAVVTGVSINDAGQVAHTWRLPGSIDAQFLGVAGDLGNSTLLVRTGDSIDLTGDGAILAPIVDFIDLGFTGPNNANLAGNGIVYLTVVVEVSMFIERYAVLRIGDAPCTGDIDDSGEVGFADLLAVLADFGCDDGGCVGDIDGSGATGFADILAILSLWGPCRGE